MRSALFLGLLAVGLAACETEPNTDVTPDPVPELADPDPADGALDVDPLSAPDGQTADDTTAAEETYPDTDTELGDTPIEDGEPSN